MSRRSEYLFVSVLLFLIGLVCLFMIYGCASTEPPPCVPEVKWLTPPPEEVKVVVTFSVEIPGDPEYKFIEFEHEIEGSAEEYVEVLYNDLIECTEKFVNAKIELIRIEVAQAAAVEANRAATDSD